MINLDILLEPFAWLLLKLYGLVNNYGIALILFAILVKLILFPVSIKGKKSMIKMNLLSAQTQKLQKMYGNNTARYNEEVQKLYDEEGVNPMGGCLWTLVPLIVLIPLYSVIRRPLKYMMHLTTDQIAKVANVLNWNEVAVSMGWAKEDAIAKAIEASTEAGGVISGFAQTAYNELYLTSLINDSNLSAVQAAVGEGAEVFALNFNFLGIDLSQVPTWQFWSNGLDWTTIGLFLLVVVSAVSSIISTRVTMKTNSMNNGQADQIAQSNKTMMWMTPIMSIWIGFMMPGLLNVYWVANNVLAMAQELIAGKILKKDYEKARIAQAEALARAKEEEKAKRRELAEQKARAAEEAKKNKNKQAVKSEEKRDAANIEASRVGIRSYARGRSYDPNRFGEVTPYKDPDVTAREKAEKAKQEAAAEADKKTKKSKKAKKAEEVKPVEVSAPVEEKVTAAPAEVVEEVAAPVSEEAVKKAVEPAVENTEAKE